MKNDENTSCRPFIKNAYYPGKLLHAVDFIREQEYGNRKLEFLNRKFYGWGIIDGMEVREGRDGSLYLSSGSAIDPCGRILVVPGDRRLETQEIEGFQPQKMQDFILGIRYAEQTVETETTFFEKKERLQPAKIMESYSLGAFGEQEFQKLRTEAARGEDILTEERILYESEELTLAVRVPKVIPTDSIFRFCICVRTAGGNSIPVGWRGMAKLQGAFFTHSGEIFSALEEEQAVCSGSLEREWEICTEENRKLPVLLEIGHLEIVTGQAGAVEVPGCQFCVETVSDYQQIVKKYLQNHSEYESQEDWVPIARLRVEENSVQGIYRFILQKEKNVRFYAVRPGEEEILRRIAEENGIRDIWWRRILRHIGPAPIPAPPSPPVPEPPSPPVPLPREQTLTEQQIREMIASDRKSRIRRGVAVIPVPKHCRKRQVLYSEEIPHGFPGEEVLLWCGRMQEDQPYIYWEQGKKQYKVFSGEESLFARKEDDWKIRQQAIVQNVAAGTFRIALTLTRKGRRSRSKEVAISWTAVRIG